MFYRPEELRQGLPQIGRIPQSALEFLLLHRLPLYIV
jgi:hypothetical protein